MNLELIQQDLSLTAYTVAKMLKDPKSLLAKKVKADEDFIINREAETIHQLLCKEYYLLDLKKQREKAIEEYELYEAYRTAQEAQLKNNAMVQDKRFDSLLTAQFTPEVTQQIAKLMDSLLTGVAKLNQLRALQADLLEQINQQAAQPTVLQTYKVAQVEQMRSLLSSTYVLPNGISITLDPNSEIACKGIQYAENRPTPPQVFSHPVLQEKRKEMIQQESVRFASTHSHEETKVLATKAVDTKMQEMYDLQDFMIRNYWTARSLQADALKKHNVDLSRQAAFSIIKLQYVITSTMQLSASEVCEQHRQEQVQFHREQSALQLINEQIQAQEKFVVNEQEQLLNTLMEFVQFENKAIYENRRIALHGFFDAKLGRGMVSETTIIELKNILGPR